MKPANKLKRQRTRKSPRRSDAGVNGLRGLLPTPPQVKRLVAREAAQRPMSANARQWVTDCFNMQYYFGGHYIAYRKTERGVEVLAVGVDEIGQLMDRIPPAEDPKIIIGCPDPW